MSGYRGSGSSGSQAPALPTGYEWRAGGVNGDLQLWKTDVTPNVLITSANVGIFDVNGSLKAAINTIYLEDAHTITSSGEEVVFQNIETGVHYTPVWGFTSRDGATVGKASCLDESQSVVDLELNGAIGAAIVPAFTFYTITQNLSIYSYSVNAAEPYTGLVTLEVLNSNGKQVYLSEKNISVSDGDVVSFANILYRVRSGNIRSVSVKKRDGEYLNVYSGLTDAAAPYVVVKSRAFTDRTIATLDATNKVPVENLPNIDTVDRITVSDQAARLAIPVSSKFVIAIQTDTQRQYYLEASQDPSVLSNWQDGGSVASSVTAFNGRTGNVTPQGGDYTASQVGAVSAPASDGVRRVLIGATPTAESIVDNLTTTSANQPLSAGQGKVLQDTKQDVITGAATSIAATNLTASRALASDASGKVAVSTVTSTELSYLGGTTSGIQTQISGKQATITGAASTITNTNLNPSVVVVADASGKVASSTVTSTELGYISGLTSSAQTQISDRQRLLGIVNPCFVIANGAGATTINQLGGTWTATGTATAVAMATSTYGMYRKISYVSAATAASNAQMLGPAAFTLGQGFYFSATFSLHSGAPANMRLFVGLDAANFANTSTTTALNRVGVCFDPTETNMFTVQNGATGTAVRTNLTSNFPTNVVGTTMFRLEMLCVGGSGVVTWKITNLISGTSSTGTFSGASIPASTTLLRPNAQLMTTAAAAVGLGIVSMNVE